MNLLFFSKERKISMRVFEKLKNLAKADAVSSEIVATC
jgi:hypothetical protein